MSGKEAKGLIMGKANKDKEKKKPISRSSRRAGLLQVYSGMMIAVLLICAGGFIPTPLPPQRHSTPPAPTHLIYFGPPPPRRPSPPKP